MKKLTRYTDFESMKLDYKPNNHDASFQNRLLKEWEEFIILLKSKISPSSLSDVNIPFINYDDLIEDKKANSRVKDIDDIEQLKKNRKDK